LVIIPDLVIHNYYSNSFATQIMDLTQVKLSKTEWDSTEVPISPSERRIVEMIMKGYDNINIRENPNQSLASYMRMSTVPGVHDYVFINYFNAELNEIDKSLAPKVSDKKIKKADKMKLDLNKKEALNSVDYFEKKIVSAMKNLIKCIRKNSDDISSRQHVAFHLHYVTLHKLMLLKIDHINTHVVTFATNLLKKHEDKISLKDIFTNAQTILEKNKTIIDNGDISLYLHQKDIFRTLRNPEFENRHNMFRELDDQLKDVDNDDEPEIVASLHAAHRELITPKSATLVLYSAPTGTGKTLTPIALAKSYRILFVCAARHVGLALAKNAVSVGRKIAFAFGCETADDIRLHYSAASVYSRNKRTGGIGKVDNSVGDKVEIMICDVKSYLCAMRYMLAFNPVNNILMYWDEPTISMDYETHPLHEMVSVMWNGNVIPNIVLSSATLPDIEDLRGGVIQNFGDKFPAVEVNVVNIQSHDSKKSIPVIDRHGYNVAPHFLKECEEYSVMKSVIDHCTKNKTLLRYIDLQACVEFVIATIDNNYVYSRYSLERTFTCIDDISITSIKEYYLAVAGNIIDGAWGAVITNLKITRKQKIISNVSVDTAGKRIPKVNSIGPGITSPPTECLREDTPGSYITTKDAETLTDGPTIFIAEDVEKIAKFYLKQSYIPASVLVNIMERIDHNNKLSERIAELEASLEDEETSATSSAADNGKKGGKSNDKKDSKRIERELKVESQGRSTKISKIHEELSGLQRSIKIVELNEVFVPNKGAHIDRWASDVETKTAFTSNVSEENVHDIMAVQGVSDIWKILLLMGIGVFANHNSQSYTEIMKRMANDQRLYLIIASSDYIYGTNYQFCHGYIGKDVALTQQKMLQALGRIGRHNDQKEYSVRLRENTHSQLLFMPSTNKVEANNMNRLFTA